MSTFRQNNTTHIHMKLYVAAQIVVKALIQTTALIEALIALIITLKH